MLDKRFVFVIHLYVFYLDPSRARNSGKVSDKMCLVFVHLFQTEIIREEEQSSSKVNGGVLWNRKNKNTKNMKRTQHSEVVVAVVKEEWMIL